MKWKIKVCNKPDVPDTAGQDILEDIADLGFSGVNSVQTAKIYRIEGKLQVQEINRICSELLADSITQVYCCQRIDGCSEISISEAGTWIVEVRFKPGVTDAVGESVIKGIDDLGISGISAAQTGQEYRICGRLHRRTIETISRSLLANEVIQTFTIK